MQEIGWSRMRRQHALSSRFQRGTQKIELWGGTQPVYDGTDRMDCFVGKLGHRSRLRAASHAGTRRVWLTSHGRSRVARWRRAAIATSASSPSWSAGPVAHVIFSFVPGLSRPRFPCSRRQLAGLWPKAARKSLHRCAWSEKPTLNAISHRGNALVTMRWHALSKRLLIT